MGHPVGMLPRLPYLPARHRRFQPLLLGVIAIVSLVFGLVTDNRGMVIIGCVGVLGAVLGVISARLAEAPDPADGESAVKD